MTWSHVRSNHQHMLEEQWIFRAQSAPAISLKRDAEAGRDCWRATLLQPSGISTATLLVSTATLEQAQRDCEHELRRMGWSWGAAAGPSGSATESA